MLIRIIKVPAGEAPEEIRWHWVGVSLNGYPAPGPVSPFGLVTGKVVKMGACYYVDRDYALTELAKKSPTAAGWFRANIHPSFTEFVFNAEEAEEISETGSQSS